VKRRDFVSTVGSGTLGLGVLGSSVFSAQLQDRFVTPTADFTGWLWIGSGSGSAGTASPDWSGS
jgi:hypothetical protein